MSTETAEEGKANVTDGLGRDAGAARGARGTSEADRTAGAIEARESAEGEPSRDSAAVGDNETVGDTEVSATDDHGAGGERDDGTAGGNLADDLADLDDGGGAPAGTDDHPPDENADGDPDGLDDQEGSGRRGRRWPRVVLVAGIAIAAAAIVGGAVAIVGSVTHGFKKPVKVTYKSSAVFSLKTGDCLDPQGQSYTLIPCDTPHQAEVFATFALAGGQYPGSSALGAAAGQGCASRLAGYLNPQLAISLASAYVYPDATAWQAGTRTVICEVKAASGELSGSVRGASASAG